MSKAKAFALIELLVVVAIVAILVAILLPSLQADERLASSSACLSNEKTLLPAWTMYADDGSRYGENEGAWAIRGVEQPLNPAAWAFYDPLASYHLKSFGFADGHAERRRRMDRRTL